MKTALYLIHALSPLHAGTGQSVGAIDLPIARERPTGIPIVPGSSIKGALRARYEEPDKHTIFGPDTDNASEFAGAVQFSDAHLLLLPVRSIAGTFAWVTSPYLVQRFARDAREAGHHEIHFAENVADESKCLVAKESSVIKTKIDNADKVILEDLDFDANPSNSIDALAQKIGEMLFPGDLSQWRDALKKRLCVVHDDVMSLLLETATEVVARIKLNEESKTVQDGGLWYEEALPTESVLYGLVAASKVSEKIVNTEVKRMPMEATALLDSVDRFTQRMGMLQLGGKGTVGRGVCALRVVNDAITTNRTGKAGAK